MYQQTSLYRPAGGASWDERAPGWGAVRSVSASRPSESRFMCDGCKSNPIGLLGASLRQFRRARATTS